MKAVALETGRFADFRENFPVFSDGLWDRIYNLFNPNMIAAATIGTCIAIPPSGVSHHRVGTSVETRAEHGTDDGSVWHEDVRINRALTLRRFLL